VASTCRPSTAKVRSGVPAAHARLRKVDQRPLQQEEGDAHRHVDRRDADETDQHPAGRGARRASNPAPALRAEAIDRVGDDRVDADRASRAASAGSLTV
jgi:hypothetical protein